MEKLPLTKADKYGFIICTIIIPLLLMFVVHYQASKDILLEQVQEQPALEVSPGLADLFLKLYIDPKDRG